MYTGFRFLLLLTLAAALFGRDWPQWRGPNANGTAEGDAPLEWSDTKNVAWKAAVPGRGFSSPVVAGGKVFLTTAVAVKAAEKKTAGSDGGTDSRQAGWGGGAGTGSEYRFDVMAFDARTGGRLWVRTAATATPHEGHHQRYGSFASNSPVTDGERVYAFFGSRGVYCYDVTGDLKWHRKFAPLSMAFHFGEGTAPVLHEGMLILNFDQEKDSHLLVLDAKTGKDVWRVERDEPTSWAPPLVVEHEGRKQLIVSGTKKVRSYELATGKLIWECGGLGMNVIPAPVAGGGVVYAMSGFQRDPNLLAIRLGATGDLTGTQNVLWTNRRGTSYTPSPVLQDGRLYFLTDSGRLSCLDAATGKAIYAQQGLGKPYNFKASPVAANGKLYLASEEGDTVVVAMNGALEVVAVNTLADETFIASPAIAGGALYLRGQNTLYCIRAK